MNVKVFIVLVFHSTFTFQSCKIIQPFLKPEKPVEVKTQIVLPEVDTTSQLPELDTTSQLLEVDTTSQNLDKYTKIVEIEDIVEIDIFHTGFANLISGMDKLYFDSLIQIDDDFWNDFSSEINEDYKIINDNRLIKMQEWSNNSFISSDIDTLLVFYPFSGPDFLHVNYLYPNANEYILLALEKIGQLPDFQSISQKDLEVYLENTNHFLRDIYLRSYFITKHMKLDIEKDKKIPGVLSSLYWFLSRTHHNIVKVEMVTLDEDGFIKVGNANNVEGIRFYFVKEGNNKVQKLTYLSCDISDDGFDEENPELLIFLRNMRQCNTFVKSASYLMHYRSFSQIREVILDKSITLFQDDTGIPYKYLSKEDWDIRCFGNYVKPIPDFEKNYDVLYQNDLDYRYTQGSEKLPFSLGYHWRDASEQNQLLGIKIVE